MCRSRFIFESESEDMCRLESSEVTYDEDGDLVVDRQVKAQEVIYIGNGSFCYVLQFILTTFSINNAIWNMHSDLYFSSSRSSCGNSQLGGEDDLLLIFVGVPTSNLYIWFVREV